MFEGCTEKLGEDIYVYKNFLSAEEAKDITDYLESLDESYWLLDSGRENVMTHTRSLDIIDPIRSRIQSLLSDGYFVGMSTSGTRMLPGNTWGVHTDVYDFLDILKLADLYADGMEYEEKELSFFGTVVYFNNFDGGEIFYPAQGIVYKQSPGDLVIHGSGDITAHGVKPVTGGKRYSFSSNILKNVRIPLNIDKDQIDDSKYTKF
jgi:hypothetical protein